MIGSLRRTARLAIRATARDVTAATASRPALVLAPHPDDETLGCGATILRKLAHGTPVTVVVLTDGSGSHRTPTLPADQLVALRHAEMTEAAERLGLPTGALRWGGFRDGELASREGEVVRVIEGLIAELRPAEVYATSAKEPHPDHAALGRAARRAAAGTADVTVLEYPVWLWGSWPLQAGDRVRSTRDAAALVLGRRAVRVRSESYAPVKLHALDAHGSQLRRPSGVPAGEEWAVLPPHVLDAAAEPVELFFPWRG